MDLRGGFPRDVCDELIWHIGHHLVEEVVSARIVLWQSECLGETRTVGSGEAFCERFPSQAVLVDVADEVAVGADLAQPDRFAAAVLPGLSAGLSE